MALMSYRAEVVAMRGFVSISQGSSAPDGVAKWIVYSVTMMRAAWLLTRTRELCVAYVEDLANQMFVLKNLM